VLGYTDEKVVATDFRGESCTSVFDSEAGIALDDTFVKSCPGTTTNGLLEQGARNGTRHFEVSTAERRRPPLQRGRA